MSVPRPASERANPDIDGDGPPSGRKEDSGPPSSSTPSSSSHWVASFLDHSGDEIRASLPVIKDRNPTVKDWRAVLALGHFLAPSHRWVFLLDSFSGDGEILDQNDEELLPDDIERRELHAIVRRVPDLIKRLDTASAAQQSDRFLVLRAVENDPKQFQFASEELRRDREIVEAAIEATLPESADMEGPECFFEGSPWRHVSCERLKEDSRIVRNACVGDPSVLRVAPLEVRTDRQFVFDLIRRERKTRGQCFGQWNLFENGDLSEDLLNDREFMTSIVSLWPADVQFAGQDLQSNRDFALHAIRVLFGKRDHDWSDFYFFPKSWRDDVEMVLTAFEHCKRKVSEFAFKPEGLGIRGGGGLSFGDWEFFTDVSERLRGVKEVAMTAVRAKGFLIQCISSDLQKQPDIVHAAMEEGRWPCAKLYLHYSQRDLPYEEAVDLVRKCPSQYNAIVAAIPNVFLQGQCGRELAQIVVDAGSLNGFIADGRTDGLGHTSSLSPQYPRAGLVWLSDREIVLRAVRVCGQNLEKIGLPYEKFYGGRENPLFRDREIVLAALTNDPQVFPICHVSLRHDRVVVLRALGVRRSTDQESAKIDEPGYGDLAEEILQKQQDAIVERPKLIRFARGRHIWGDVSLIQTVVRSGCPEVLRDRTKEGDWSSGEHTYRGDSPFYRYASEARDSLERGPCADRKTILSAVEQNGLLLDIAAAHLKDDAEIVSTAVRQSGLSLEFASADLKNDRDIVLLSVVGDGLALEFASADLKNDRDVVTAAVARNGLALQHASDRLRGQHSVVLVAVQQNGRACELASTLEIQTDPEIKAAARASNLAACEQFGREMQEAV